MRNDAYNLLVNFKQITNKFDSDLNLFNSSQYSSNYIGVMKKLEDSIALAYQLTMLLSYAMKFKYEIKSIIKSSGQYSAISNATDVLNDIKDDIDKYKTIAYTISENNKCLREIMNIKYNNNLS